MSTIPAAIERFVSATNDGDTEAFVAAFTPDAYLNDWGREFHGRDGVRSWSSTDNIGVQSHFDVVSVEQPDSPGTYVVVLRVSGNGYNGTGPLTFVLQDGLIARLIISE
ncbi:ketosteroid isomerase [Aeromicrobium chenweiae]|uniref:Ketosteroid isomerase n=2 Tax=Aeromicrobium chenweiae TaxID=2079793 RepID=A0A2S0WRY6_9ACTN|nr:ketosteroid isomerase [Aeromicrobium chenweiae]TGN31553.1 nuclear transport factor 2 family protein [Aeromicrobium chenweiae]